MRLVKLASPNRLASFLLRLFSSNSDVLELARIHLHQLSSLPVALMAQSPGGSDTMKDFPKKNDGNLGDLVIFTGLHRTRGTRIRLFLSLHNISLDSVSGLRENILAESISAAYDSSAFNVATSCA